MNQSYRHQKSKALPAHALFRATMRLAAVASQVTLLLFLVQVCWAQSPATARKPAPAAPKATPIAGPVGNTPSRLIDGEEYDSYVASLTAAFSMHSRTYDPFGQNQDPNAKPIIKTPIAKATQRTPIYQVTPFSEIVRLIVINTILPKEKRFLVGTRLIAEGDKVPLSFRGRAIQVQVMEVSSQKIVFRNLDNGEIATRKLEMLPPGMAAGLDGITAPGMVAERRNAPIELDAGDSPDQTSQNR